MSVVPDVALLTESCRYFDALLHLCLVHQHAWLADLSSELLRRRIDRLAPLNLTQGVLCLQAIVELFHFVNAHDPMFGCIGFFDVLQIEILISYLYITSSVETRTNVPSDIVVREDDETYPGGDRTSV